MPELIFVTGNSEKYASADAASKVNGIKLRQSSIDIDEVQHEDPEYITRRKAEAAHAKLGMPLVVSDDSWQIHGLKGFPGPYMKSMNHWFSTDDFLRLTSHLADRSVDLVKLLVYQDENIQKVFYHKIPGTILTESHGHSDMSWLKLVSMDGDDGLTLAEVYEKKERLETRRTADIWYEFAAWYKEYTK